MNNVVMRMKIDDLRKPDSEYIHDRLSRHGFADMTTGHFTGCDHLVVNFTMKTYCLLPVTGDAVDVAINELHVVIEDIIDLGNVSSGLSVLLAQGAKNITVFFNKKPQLLGNHFVALLREMLPVNIHHTSANQSDYPDLSWDSRICEAIAAYPSSGEVTYLHYHSNLLRKMV